MRCVPTVLAFPFAIGLAPSQQSPPKPTPQMAQVAAAYAAKITASAVFVSRRTLASVLAQELSPTRAMERMIQPLLRLDIDRTASTVTCTIGQAKAIAVHKQGLGCSLVPPGVPIETVLQHDIPALPRAGIAITKRIPGGSYPYLWPDFARAEDTPIEGVDYEAIRRAVDKAFREEGRKHKIHTRAIVIAYQGKLIMERYAQDVHAGMPLPGWSMSKTLTNALIGMRIGEGKLKINAPAIAAKAPPIDGSTSPAEIEIRHLLTMTAGLEWNEDYNDPTSDALRMLFGSTDHALVYRERPPQTAPGKRFQYASGATNQLCQLLRASFANDTEYWHYPQRLFEALGMKTAVLETDAHGTFVGSSYGYACARDWARLGLLYQGDGVFRGKRLLPAGWVRQSTTPAPASNGRYGYQIWLNADPDGDGPRQRMWPGLPADLFSMQGHEGQYCIISPSAELVIVRLGCTKNGGFDLTGLLRAVHAATSKR